MKKYFINLFKGLLFSKLDGSTLVIVDKQRGKKYAPSSAIKMPPFPVQEFEQAILFRLSDSTLNIPELQKPWLNKTEKQRENLRAIVRRTIRRIDCEFRRDKFDHECVCTVILRNAGAFDYKFDLSWKGWHSLRWGGKQYSIFIREPSLLLMGNGNWDEQWREKLR